MLTDLDRNNSKKGQYLNLLKRHSLTSLILGLFCNIWVIIGRNLCFRHPFIAQKIAWASKAKPRICTTFVATQ